MSAFISTEVEVLFGEEPLIKKRPGLPDAFLWEGERHDIVELLAEWHDYSKSREVGETRRTQAQFDRQRGSWGVGRDYYRVRTSGDRIFELYYDRRPRSRTITGVWALYRELDPDDLPF